MPTWKIDGRYYEPDDVRAMEAQLAFMTPAARDAFAERRRQIEAEGWTAEHDDAHEHGEMARAAASYALIAGSRDRSLWRGDIPNFWPWEARWWKPTTRRRDLVKAAALILAEIERLDRAEAGQ